jgi:hypothetical protein
MLLVEVTGGWDYYFCSQKAYKKANEIMLTNLEEVGQIPLWEQNLSIDG